MNLIILAVFVAVWKISCAIEWLVGMYGGKGVKE